MGLLSTISSSVTPIAMGLGGVIADQTGRNIPLIFSVCSVILLVLALIIAASPAIRAFLAYRPEQGPLRP
jgi:MFS family permease